ncbi:MAG: SEL1-like repeat protein [Synergistaceae bacterium]|nr:SEL1-like repeat protein [Synergistaceae bacterium]
MKFKVGQKVTIEGTCIIRQSPFSLEKCRIVNAPQAQPQTSTSNSQVSAPSAITENTPSQTNETETEFERIQRLAQQGDANAQNKLGTMYEFGNGVAKDYNQAAEWYQKAAQQGLGLAQMNLAELYEKIEQNYAIAEYWYKEAANQGQAGAKTALERVQMKMGKEPTKTETAHTLQKPRTFDAAKGNAATFLTSIEDVAEKLMNTESYKTQDIEVIPADEYRNESETVYMRAWHNERYFMFCNYANSPRPVACFRTTSPEFTFAGGIKVGTSFNSIRDLFGDFGSWNADSNTLYINVASIEASVHITDGRVDYIEYSYLGAEYTHKMSNLLFLYRGDIYSASITTESNSKLNVRSAPDTHSEVLFQVLKNNNILFIDNSSGVIGNGGNKWYRVRFVYDDSANTISSVNEAYVYGKYINIMPLTYGERESLINAFN